jgi:ABC-2 type transport system ATP-binding protein
MNDSQSLESGGFFLVDSAVLVEGLEKSFKSVKALKGIDLSVEAGTIFGLLGPNGAGKTTAIRILSTIIRPDSGRALVMGRDVVREREAVRRRIGLAGQNAAVDPNLTGRENLKMIGRLARMSRHEVIRRASELLESFDLMDAADRPLRTYSGGMRRRLDVAAALVQRPPVIFLDEPTTGLDIQGRMVLWEHIRHLVAEGVTFLLTTQDLREADLLADRVAVIDEGVVVAENTASALKARLGSAVVELEMANEPEGATTVELLSRRMMGRVERDGSMVKIRSEDSTSILIEALRVLEHEGVTPRKISLREPSLDDVFLVLTGNGLTGAAMPGD